MQLVRQYRVIYYLENYFNMKIFKDGKLEETTLLEKLVGFEIDPHDYISLSYTGSDLTGVVYKKGGSGGSTVATLTLAYSGGNLTEVTKT